MKICSLYGAGFYYIPGTDTCIKLGGYVRSEWLIDAGGSFVPYINGTNALNTRAKDQLVSRSRGIMSLDARSQTEYGTLRSYMRAGWQWTTGDAFTGGSNATTYMDRAFIQLGGLTMGKTQSFYDFFNTPSYSNQTSFLWRDTGGTGVPVFAYTAQFGNGLSGTLSIEDGSETNNPIVLGPFASPAGATHLNSSAGNKVPDVVGVLRLDQAWGSAQIAGAMHYLSATYYSGANQTSHPDDRAGWAVGGGVKLNLPMLARNDHATISANYCEGATRFCSSTSGARGSGAGYGLVNGNTIGVAWVDDAFYNGTAALNGNLQLSRMWNILGGINHYWTPQWQTSVAGGYVKYEANSSVADAQCLTIAGAAPTGCFDWSAWTVSSRTTWTPVANLDLSVEVLYTRVDSALHGATFVTAAQGLPATLAVGNTDRWTGMVRALHSFYP